MTQEMGQRSQESNGPEAESQSHRDSRDLASRGHGINGGLGPAERWEVRTPLFLPVAARCSFLNARLRGLFPEDLVFLTSPRPWVLAGDDG